MLLSDTFSKSRPLLATVRITVSPFLATRVTKGIVASIGTAVALPNASITGTAVVPGATGYDVAVGYVAYWLPSISAIPTASVTFNNMLPLGYVATPSGGAVSSTNDIGSLRLPPLSTTYRWPCVTSKLLFSVTSAI